MQEISSRIQSIIDSMPAAIIVVKPDLTIQSWNAHIAAKTKIPANYAFNRGLTLIFPAITDYVELIHNAFDTHNIQNTHNARIIIEEADLHRLYNITVYPIEVDNQHEAVIRVDDITAQARSEFDVAQTEKLASIGASLAGVAHEINNPLAGILQSAQNILRRFDPKIDANQAAAQQLDLDLNSMQQYLQKREILQFIENIQHEGERVSALVKDMLAFVRRPPTTMNSCDILSVINDGISLAKIEANVQDDVGFKDINIVKNFPSEPLMVVCNKPELEQVIVNLLRNAAQALTDKRGAKEIKIGVSLPTKDKVRLEISDNGPGIPDQIKDKIFQPFFTTKPAGQGTGLGLSICRNIIVQHHHGTIELESKPGIYTRFIITLPLNQ